MVLGPLCGKSQVGETKYSGLVLAMVPECLEVWSFKTGACWVDVLPDVAVAMLGRSACSWRITANQQQQESYQPINQIFWSRLLSVTPSIELDKAYHTQQSTR
jgi:hypothetical protein